MPPHRRPPASAPIIGALAAFLALLLSPGRALAHAPGVNGGDLDAVLGAWTFDPIAIVLVLLSGLAYGLSLRRLRRTRPRFHFSRWRSASFGVGLLLLFLALASPIDSYGDDLFFAHMLQHVLVMVVVAPLLVLGAPLTLVLAAASPRIRAVYLRPFLRGRVLRALTLPPVALVLFVGVTWLWHLPALYDAAIGNELLHGLEHISFLTVSVLFWWLIIDADRSALRPPHPVRGLMLLAAIIQGIGLGVLLIQVDEAIYTSYIDAAAARDWGPAAYDDQRIGAGLVWIPAGLAYALALLITLQRWMDQMEERTARDDAARLRQISTPERLD